MNAGNERSRLLKLAMLGLLALPLLQACAPTVKSPEPCANVEVSYLGMIKGGRDRHFGQFKVKNTGEGVYKLPVIKDLDVMHYMYAEVQVESSSGEWEPRVVLLDSWTRPSRELVVAPGMEVDVGVDDPIFNGEAEVGRRYAVLFRDMMFRCEVRSDPFVLEK